MLSEVATSEPADRCMNLWRSVVLQLVVDATHSGTLAAIAAREWLTWPSRDRAVVLELAGVNLEAFISRGLPRLQAAWAAIDAAPPKARRQWSPAQNAARSAAQRRRAQERRLSYA